MAKYAGAVVEYRAAIILIDFSACNKWRGITEFVDKLELKCPKRGALFNFEWTT